jgi:hypothetical protein
MNLKVHGIGMARGFGDPKLRLQVIDLALKFGR